MTQTLKEKLQDLVRRKASSREFEDEKALVWSAGIDQFYEIFNPVRARQADRPLEVR